MHTDSRSPTFITAGVGLFATKAGMMSYFTEDGLCVPATVIALEEGNIVTMVSLHAAETACTACPVSTCVHAHHTHSRFALNGHVPCCDYCRHR